MSTAHSRARSQSRAPSNARVSAPIVVSSAPKPPIEVVLPAAPRSRSRGPPVFVEAPGLSGGRGMFKRLIVACDGTWMNADNGLVNGKIEVPSNVTRISRAIKAVSQDGIPQIVNYHFGVGTQGTPLSRFVSGTTGEGLSDNVREAYSFLANNYHPGDEIFLLGFSRGAFTARSIGGLIGEIGLLTKKGLPSLAEIFQDVRHRRNPDYVPKNPDIPFPRKPSADDPRYASELERRGLTRLDIRIKAIAVWDTVGSLGTPRVGWLTKVGLQSNESKEMSFYDTKLANCVENAFQALALDERRSAFSPAIWEKPEGNRTTLRQVWFPGAHSNVGGGYDDQQLANITLAWMMSQLAPFLDLREEYVFEQEDDNEKYYRREGQEIRPWSFGEITNSMKGLYALGGRLTRTPGFYKEVDPFTGRTTDRPLRLTNEYIHASVRTRFRLDGPGVSDKGFYECRALTDNYKLVVDYGADTTRAGDPDIYWKLKFKDPGAAKILPEAPLWGVEKELCRRDPETYDYVKKPPATGTAKKSKKSSGSRGLSPGAEKFNTRRSFVEEERSGKRSSAVLEKRQKRSRSRGERERPRSFDERSSVVRESMPHRREKDKAWWEGVSLSGGGPDGRDHGRDGERRRERRRSGGAV
ncbi:hypothetical protein K458DRAFT_386150 [Lentithecium fluviatile CBS 122367]|uniref:T6SS Phospholipase effector Tle1-like catalytic domain-containing protein n=1 Tax=Lentithecium fluviatile CBS 122367 TaxID=1168545 RepID=A0A6G1J9W7_9PLEO|nr:hypothetical protein K458DRAFT_386150 [Lentithecium fluviatile CBS 122367]